MPETAFSFSHVETPAPGASLPQGRHTLHGWLWPKPPGHIVDVRARIGERLFPGVHGFPRADLAAHFKTGRPVALAGFQVVVDLEPGAVEVGLEALEIDGRWQSFQTVSYQVGMANPPTHFDLPHGTLRWIDYGHGLRLLLEATARRPEKSVSALAGALAAELPYPRMLRDTPAPLIGFVDQPASVCCNHFGRVPAFGWMFHPQLRTTRVLATADLQSWQPLAIHLPSPGPGAHYSHHAHAQACGYAGLIDVPAQLPNPVSVRIYVELEDGSLQLGPVARTRLHSLEDEKSVVAPAANTFAATLAAWEEALAARRIDVAREPELERYLEKLRTDLTTAARHRPAQSAGPLVETPARTGARPPARVLLATHGLSLQGAPRFLLDLGRTFAAAGTQVEVISAEDGPLRAEFAALGATVTLVDVGALMAAGDAVTARQALATLGARADWAAADLVVANSFTTFWAVHAAKAAARPTLFYVHESTTPAAFYGTRASGAVVTLAEEAFALADAVSFTTASTRRYHLGYGRPERHRLTPGWVDVAALDRWVARQDRAALRRDLGVQPGEQLVCNIGTVSDRKGQHIFARAVDLLWRRHPDLAARTRFILLGGRDTPFDTMLGAAVAEIGRSNLIVHPETTDYLRYYLASDLFVCSSYEESSPRVVLEAMACRAPILASAVQGVPELVRADLEARLLPAGDTAAWCDGLAGLLAAPEIGRELAARARARVEEKFSAAQQLSRHLGLASAVAMGNP
jgi:glycosyltransferase involved in cell wall biosynthesis